MRKCVLTVAAAAVLTISGLANAGVYRTITVDGNVSDWAGINPTTADSSSKGTTAGPVFTNVYVANDSNYLYFRFQLAQAADATGYQNNFFINTDGNAGSGFQSSYIGTGSELLIESGVAYQEAGGGYNEGQLTNTAVVASTPGSATDGFEFAIPLNTKFQYGAAYTGKSIFTGSNVSILLTSDTSGAYAGPVDYTLASPTPEPATLGLLGLGALPLMRRRRSV